MHLYLNYAREHWTIPGENPPVGLILCSAKNEAIVKYSLAGHPSKVLAAEYRMALPDEKLLADHVEQARAAFTRRGHGALLDEMLADSGGPLTTAEQRAAERALGIRSKKPRRKAT
jgi:hypothetical protein